MKGLLLGVALLVLVGIFGFFYRNIMERPQNGATACTQEAKICPDGTSVGRSGPACTFTACPPPNVEVATGSSTIAFVLPAGYAQIEQGAPNQATLRIYQKPGATDSSPQVITIQDYAIPEGKTAEDVMLRESVKSPSGMPAASMKEFSPVISNGRTFESITIERFEGQIESAYYLTRANDVLRFDIVERGVTNWTDSNLIIENLPEHQALLKMLDTLQAP